MRARSALVYTVLRLAAFLVPFGLMMLLPIMREFYWLSAIFAALIGLSLSMLFLRRPLGDLSAGLASGADARRARTSRTRTSRMPQRMPPAATPLLPHRPNADRTGAVGLAQRGIRQPTNAQQRSPARASDVSDVRLSATTSSRGCRYVQTMRIAHAPGMSARSPSHASG